MSRNFKFKLNKKVALSLFLFLIIVGLVVYVGLMNRKTTSTVATGESCKQLIAYDRDGAESPSYLAANLNRLEQAVDMPYNGVVILESNASSKVFSATPVSTQMISDSLKVLRDMTNKPTKLKHNMIRVLLHDPGDMFDDAGWATVAANFQHLGEAIREANTAGFPIDGIFLDNEGPYSGPTCSTGSTVHGLWNLPAKAAYGETTEYQDHKDCWPYIRNWGTYGEAQYIDKARTRGSQLMASLKTGFPEAKIILAHSSDVSCTNMNTINLQKNDVSYANEMLGPFAVGMGEAAKGSSAKVIDGGEEAYYFRTGDKFDLSYSVRNLGMATTYASYCPFIPAADRPIWSDLFDIGFGLYNKTNVAADSISRGLYGGQTETSIGQSVQLALEHADNYVWFYTENVNSLDPQKTNYIGSTWNNNIWNGRQAVLNDVTCGATATPTATASTGSTGQPDLAITAVHLNPATPVPGNEVTFTVDLTNQGNAATPTGTGIFLGAAFKIDGAWVTWSDNYTGSLLPGQSLTLTPNYGSGGKATWTATAGTHTLGTYLNNTNVFAESNLANNSDERTLNIGTSCQNPATPETFSATANAASPASVVDLAWTDNTADHDGFRIFRSSNSTSGFAQIVELTATSRSFTDSTLLAGTTYYYQLKAYKGSCESTIKSTSVTTGQSQAVLSLAQEPSSAGSRTNVTITATLSNSSKAKNIYIFIDGMLKKSCSAATSCTLSQKYAKGTHTYYASSVMPNLRSPVSGTNSFDIVWWKFW